LNDAFFLSQLQELAQKLGVAVRYEHVIMKESPGMGGLCRIEGEYVLIIHSQATVEEKIHVMTKALRRFDLGDIYIRPVIRKLLEESAER